MRKKREIFLLLAIPLAMSFLVAWIFYPGFMTYDTLHALRGARNGVTDSAWPPMVSYVWRAVDHITPNPSAMHFSQVFVLLFSIFFIIFYLTEKITYATLFLLIYLSIPVLLGTVAVIWKDVLMSAFFMAGLAAILEMKSAENRFKAGSLFVLAVFLIFLGVSSRHNAIIAALPLFYYIAWVVCIRTFKNRTKLIISTIVLGSLLTGAVFFSKTQLDRYAIPGFQKLAGTTDLIPVVRVMDIAGASVCTESNLFFEMSPDLTPAEIRNSYDPRHSNLSLALFDKISPLDNRIDKLWLSTAINHPACFLYNKVQLTKYLVGANEGEQFLITAPYIEANEFGYNLPHSVLRERVVTYIISASNWIFLKPWFLYVVSTVALIYVFLIGKITVEIATIFLSAAFYFIGLIMFGNAADARLLFYTTSLLLMVAFISTGEVIKHYTQR
jgi:hypothetical protein